MVQESMVEYINAQMKLGTSRDAIKATLTGAGWAAADVEDTLKKVESAKTVQTMPTTTSAPAMMAATQTTAAQPAAMPATTMNTAPKTIQMSDLVSTKPGISSKSPLTGSTPTAGVAPVIGVSAPATKKADTFPSASFGEVKPHGSHGTLITEIVLGIIILAVGAFAGFLFMQNNSLHSQLSSLNGQSAGVNSQLSAIQAQMAASTTAMTAQLATLDAANQELQTELSFFVPSPSSTPGTVSNATVNGTVSFGKSGYVITATYGTEIFVANGKSSNVIAALTPLLATPGKPSTTTSTAGTTTTTAAIPPTAATTAQFTGTYIPGSNIMTLTAINGTPL